MSEVSGKMNDLQRCLLDIYKEVSKICKKNNILYYAIGGTCLGAVRHKGFIPWDDDLDLGMPIEYLDKFIECCHRELPKRYRICSAKDITHYEHTYVRVVDIETTFIQKHKRLFPEAYSGAWVDIINLTSVPNKKIYKYCYLSKLRLYKSLNYYRRFNESCAEVNGKFRYLKKLLRPILRYCFSVNYFHDKWLDLLKKNPFSSDMECGMVVFENLVFKKCYFAKTIISEFEDISLPLPHDYDGYLINQYGDYMKLPPVEERVNHMGFIDLDRPFSYYLDKVDLVKKHFSECKERC